MNEKASPAAADVPPFAAFGSESRIAPPFTVTCPERIHIGANVTIGARSWLSVVDKWAGRRYEPELLIHDGAVLGSDMVIACIGRVEVGSRVLTGSRVFIGDTYHDYRDPEMAVIDQPMSDPAPITIGDGAFLGIGSVILPGVAIGPRAYVGAGAVVTADVPANAVVAGNPAEIIKVWEEDSRQWRTVRPRAMPRAETVEAVATTSEGNRDALGPVEILKQRLALVEAEKRAAEAEISALQSKQEQTLTVLADAERRRAEAEHWLEDHRASLTWRVTEPLRAAVRGARRQSTHSRR